MTQGMAMKCMHPTCSEHVNTETTCTVLMALIDTVVHDSATVDMRHNQDTQHYGIHADGRSKVCMAHSPEQ